MDLVERQAHVEALDVHVALGHVDDEPPAVFEAAIQLGAAGIGLDEQHLAHGRHTAVWASFAPRS